MEAMACGKPVVSTELSSGTSYVNQHGKTGLVVPPLDHSRMAEAVNLLIDRPELRAAWGKAGFERVRSRFSSDRMIDRIVDVYAAPLRNRFRRGPARLPTAGGVAPAHLLPPPVRRIKLLRIISRLNIGGPSIHVHLLTKGLDACKFETRLITGSISSREGSMEYLFGREDPKPIVISELQREIRLWSDVRAFIRIFRMLLQERPDMVHTHTAKAGFSARLAVMLYNAVTRRRVVTVHTFHGHVFEGYFHRLSAMLFVNIERLMGRFTDAVIAISPSQKKALVEKYHISSEQKVHVISLGFNLAPFLDAKRRKGAFRRRIGASGNDILIGIVGRLVPIKNHRLLLRAARQLMAVRSGRPLRFAVVGDGQLRNDLEAECRTLGIADAVHFCGWIRDIPMVYADLDILALTSINEGTPVSIIESMAASVPVMATDAGGVGDLLGTASPRGRHDGFSVCDRGVLCHHPDEARVAAALDYLVREDAELQRARVDAARHFVEARFGSGRLIREMESLYENLLNVQK
jgi:glycosyltransferase involved in cell wall biosynthesis